MWRSRSIKLTSLTSLTLAGCLLLFQTNVFAFETDQYNLSPEPLADIGEEVSEHVEQKLRTAVEKLNSEIALTEKCVTAGAPDTRCDSPEEERSKLDYLRSNDAVAHEVYQQLGTGVPPFTSMGTWMDSHHFRGEPARYQTSFGKSIFIIFPHIALTISPTVKLYGSEFGTDKIAHLFQQGYTYYRIYRRAQMKGATSEEAAHKAIRWGQKSERTFFGTLVGGVYSNGDLAANYVGMKFYEALTQEIRIGTITRPPVLLLKDGFWTFHDLANFRATFELFISDHLNEALNPSIFTKNFGLRWYIRSEVRRRSCKQWFEKYPNLSRTGLEEESRALRLWLGEDYGFTDSDHFVTIANTCFGDESVDGK